MHPPTKYHAMTSPQPQFNMADLSANTPRNEPENEREEYNYIMLPRYTNERWREGIYSVVGVDVKKTDEKYIYERDLLSDDEELELFASKHLFNFQMEYVKEEGKRFQETFKKLMAMEERRGAKRKSKTVVAGISEPEQTVVAEISEPEQNVVAGISEPEQTVVAGISEPEQTVVAGISEPEQTVVAGISAEKKSSAAVFKIPLPPAKVKKNEQKKKYEYFFDKLFRDQEIVYRHEIGSRNDYSNGTVAAIKLQSPGRDRGSRVVMNSWPC
ncbi:UNVERIFIED_CONTAM: hypothetical protein NCL1_25639 [Trichonephila clavipes]